LLNDEHRRYKMLGFIDDNPAKVNSKVQGYAVLGGHDRLIALAESKAIDCVVLSARVIDEQRLRDVERLCEANNIALSRLHLRLEQLVGP
jgi:FlaA1/EpsC-like NDP-sugar epimerase